MVSTEYIFIQNQPFMLSVFSPDKLTNDVMLVHFLKILAKTK